MPIIETKGAASSQGFGEFTTVSAPPNYIEDVFSTYLYTGNGSTQTINNGIDLAGKGGMVWTKKRSASGNNQLFDTTRGMTYSSAPVIVTNTSNQQNSFTNAIRADASGFSLGTSSDVYSLNNNAATYVSWTFRKQAKFFDIVTWTGTGSAIDVAHNLGSVPGCILIKSLNDSSAQTWYAYHRGTGSAGGVPLGLEIDLTAAALNPASNPPSNITATSFNTGAIYNSGAGTPIASGASFIAYVFAHNAGGFGLTGTDNVISCGSFTVSGTGTATVNLGYEPQMIILKDTTNAENWWMVDTMRGQSQTSLNVLRPNTSGVEINYGVGSNIIPTATGFTTSGLLNGFDTYIYIAIRRGPMKTPTSGTSVFNPNTTSGTTGTTVTTNFPVDLQITRNGARSAVTSNIAVDRLRGVSTTTTDGGVFLGTTSTNAESSAVAFTRAWDNAGFQVPTQNADVAQIYWNFRRAPGFFDEVCYTGDGTSARSITHNLGVTPQLIITKDRTGSTNWYVLNTFASAVLKLNLTDANNTGLPAYTYGNGSAYVAPTSSAFTVDVGAAQSLSLNWSGDNYVSYLFASCPGVSKVGSYTGNGSTQTINCGFTGGARFVLIKRTDSTGDWYVYDTARGMTTLTDPYLLLNSTAAESATLGSVTTVTTGFAVNASILAAINTNAASYIFWAVA